MQDTPMFCIEIAWECDVNISICAIFDPLASPRWVVQLGPYCESEIMAKFADRAKHRIDRFWEVVDELSVLQLC